MQVDQGLGVGTHNAFFNKHTLSVTRFLKLRDPAPGSSAPPWVLVLHGRCACLRPHDQGLPLPESTQLQAHHMSHVRFALSHLRQSGCISHSPHDRRFVRHCAVLTCKILRNRYGSIIGDMASYDAFTLGGPYSVRGFSVGELAACRRFAEAAVELRVPVLGRQLFAFAERGTDLGAPLRHVRWRFQWCTNTHS